MFDIDKVLKGAKTIYDCFKTVTRTIDEVVNKNRRGSEKPNEESHEKPRKAEKRSAS